MKFLKKLLSASLLSLLLVTNVFSAGSSAPTWLIIGGGTQITPIADREVVLDDVTINGTCSGPGCGGGGATDFTGLTDTPANYTGAAGQAAIVNPGETALIFSPVATNLQEAYDGGPDIDLSTGTTPFEVRDNGIALGANTTSIFPGIYADIENEGLAFGMIGDGNSGIPSVAGGQQVLLDTAVTFPAADQIEFGVDLRVQAGAVISPAAAAGAGASFINGTIVVLKSTDISPTDEGIYTIVGFQNGLTTNSIAQVVDTSTQAAPTFTATSGTAKIFKQTFGFSGGDTGGGPKHSFISIDEGNGTSPLVGIFADNGDWNNIFSVAALSDVQTSIVDITNFSNALGLSADVPFLTFNHLGVPPDTADIILSPRTADPSATPSGGVIWRTDLNQLRVANGSAWNSIAGGSLDDAYNVGPNITADTTAVGIVVPDTSNNVGLVIDQQDSTNNPAALQIINAGTGQDIQGANWAITSAGASVFGASPSLQVGLPSSATGTISFQNATNANQVNIVSGVTTATYGLTLPTAQGASGSVLTNDGTGVLSWSSAASDFVTVCAVGCDYISVSAAEAAGDRNIRVTGPVTESANIALDSGDFLNIQLDGGFIWSMGNQQVTTTGDVHVRINGVGIPGTGTNTASDMRIVSTGSKFPFDLTPSSTLELSNMFLGDFSTAAHTNGITDAGFVKIDNIRWFLPNLPNSGMAGGTSELYMRDIDIVGAGTSSDDAIVTSGGRGYFENLEFTGTWDTDVIVNVSGMTSEWVGTTSSINTGGLGLTVWTFGPGNVTGWKDFSLTGVNRFSFGGNSKVSNFEASTSELQTNGVVRIANSHFEDYNQANTPVGSKLVNTTFESAITIDGSYQQWNNVDAIQGITVNGSGNQINGRMGDTVGGGGTTITFGGTSSNNRFDGIVDSAPTDSGTNNDLSFTIY